MCRYVPVIDKLLQKNGAGEYAKVGIVSHQGAGANNEVAEDEQAEANAKESQGTQVEAEKLDKFVQEGGKL